MSTPLFTWSTTFKVGAPLDTPGDRIILPPSALGDIIQAHANAPFTPPPLPEDLDYDPTSWAPSPFSDPKRLTKPELPSPLTFQIRNPVNRLLTHGGVREFSGEEGIVQVPGWMWSSLGIQVEGDELVVKYEEMPKGAWAKFCPTSMDYLEIKDFRSSFEAFLRSNHTTLTTGEILIIQQGSSEYRFVVQELKPANAVCITDTDLEVDLEPLEVHQEEYARKHGKSYREQHQQKAKDQTLRIGVTSKGATTVEDYQRWTLDLPDRSRGLQIELVIDNDEGTDDVDLLASTQTPLTLIDHLWADFESGENTRRIRIAASDHDYVAAPEKTIHVAVYGRSSSSTLGRLISYSLRVEIVDGMEGVEASGSTSSGSKPTTVNENVPGYSPCENCGSWIPERTMMLHTNFCLRNNVKCDKCGDVMKKEEMAEHFHCDHCLKHGHVSEAKKHMELFHGWYQCECGKFEGPSLPDLAHHRRTTCPDRHIICRYCHILVQQGIPSSNPRDRMRGLLSHESYCGDRTINCQKCSQMVSLKDVQIHAQNHEYQRQNQSTPVLCLNQNCTRPRMNNVLGLCQLCFGPFWISTDDPKYMMVTKRLARSYHSQLTTGCGKNWCRNEACASFTKIMMDPTTAAAKLVQYLKQAKISQFAKRPMESDGKLWLCVNESVTQKRVLAELLCQDMNDKYALEWCVKALEASGDGTDLEAAGKWLQNHAAKKK